MKAAFGAVLIAVALGGSLRSRRNVVRDVNFEAGLQSFSSMNSFNTTLEEFVLCENGFAKPTKLIADAVNYDTWSDMWNENTPAADDFNRRRICAGSETAPKPIEVTHEGSIPVITLFTSGTKTLFGVGVPVVVSGDDGVNANVGFQYCLTSTAPADPTFSNSACGGATKATAGPYVEANIAGWGTDEKPRGGITWLGDGYYCGVTPVSTVNPFDAAAWVGLAKCTGGGTPVFETNTAVSRYGTDDPQYAIQGLWANNGNAVTNCLSTDSYQRPYLAQCGGEPESENRVYIQFACPNPTELESNYVTLAQVVKVGAPSFNSVSAAVEVTGFAQYKIVCDPRVPLVDPATVPAGTAGTFTAASALTTTTRETAAPASECGNWNVNDCAVVAPLSSCALVPCTSTNFLSGVLIADLTASCGVIVDEATQLACCEAQYTAIQNNFGLQLEVCACRGVITCPVWVKDDGSKKGLLGLLGLLGLIPLLLCLLASVLLACCLIRRKKTEKDVHFATFDPHAASVAAPACTLGTVGAFPAPTTTVFP